MFHHHLQPPKLSFSDAKSSASRIRWVQGWIRIRGLPSRKLTYHPTKREVGKIIDSKSDWGGGDMLVGRYLIQSPVGFLIHWCSWNGFFIVNRDNITHCLYKDSNIFRSRNMAGSLYTLSVVLTAQVFRAYWWMQGDPLGKWATWRFTSVSKIWNR